MDNNPVSVTDPLGLSPNWLEAKVTALYRPSTPYESVELSSDGHSNEASDAFKEACIQRSVEYSQATAEEDAVGNGEGPTSSTTQGDASVSNSSSSEVCNNDASSSGSASDVAGNSDGDDGKKTPMGPFTDEQLLVDDPSSSKEGKTISSEYKKSTPAVLVAEGIGALGGYTVSGNVISTITDDGGANIKVLASGTTTTASSFGNVDFYGNAQLIVNGKVVSSQTFPGKGSNMLYSTGTSPMGSVNFVIPQLTNQTIEIRINAGYMYSTDGEGRLFPIPSQIHQTIKIR